MDEYFGVAVAGWTDEGGFYHNGCLDLEAVKENDLFVTPIFPDAEEHGDSESRAWRTQPVCQVCHLPIIVNVTQKVLEEALLVPAGE